jgi:hypothetical protein
MGITDQELEHLLKSATTEEQPPKKRGGRPKGATNLFSRQLRECLLLAAEQSIWAKNENDPSAQGSVTSFLTAVADKWPDKFAQMLCKLLPQQHLMQKTEPQTEVTYENTDQVKRALEQEGFTLKQIEQLESLLPVTAHNDGDDDE